MRADLAGGTLDIYPLHVFLGSAVTVNVALTLTSEVSIETLETPAVTIISDDLEIEQTAPDAASLDPRGPLGFIAGIVKFYKPGCGLVVRTLNNVPKGSGLGASSTLLIALSHALNKLNGSALTSEEIINIGANIEAEYIQVPTGKQDYFSASYGGLSAIYFQHDRNRHEHISSDEKFLSKMDERMVISFAGAPRFSGASNWNMTKAFIDGDPQARGSLEKIKSIALDMRAALAAQDFDAFARLLSAEWEHRRNIAEGVSTPEIERMMAAAAGAGAKASKVCGAGGGGCMITLSEPGAKNDVRAALASAGAQVLDCSISRWGVRVEAE